jgi:hypothetical protein
VGCFTAWPPPSSNASCATTQRGTTARPPLNFGAGRHWLGLRRAVAAHADPQRQALGA